MAGAPPPTKTVVRVQEELGWEFIQIYGLTETSPLLTFNRTRAEWDHLPAEERAGLLTRAGAPALGVRLSISEADGENEGGEVLARSNVVLEGYWDQPEESARALAGGWFHTGDLAVWHEDGYAEIKDRLKDIIISGGENISTIEVEDTLYKPPAVMEAAVVARPDEKWGETPCAFVKLKIGYGEVTEADIIAHCRKHLASFKVPKTVIFSELPKTSTGKIQKFVLREEARQHQSGEQQ